MVSTELTRYEQSLGDQDTITGVPIASYVSSTIHGSIQPKGATPLGLPLGNQTRYEHTLYTKDIVYVNDQVMDAWNRVYRIESVTIWPLGDSFSHRVCGCTELNMYDSAASSSGTWHLDSNSYRTDPRYLHRLWLSTYMNTGNLKKNNGTTLAATWSMFAGGETYLPTLFKTKAIDGVFIIDKAASKPRETDKHYPYAFDETVPITCYAIDKSTVTATNLVEQMEQEIRHVATDHPLGSIRSIDSTNHKWTDIGGVKLWETTVTIKYSRANDDYLPSYPTITWGPSAAPTGTFIFPNVTHLSPPFTSDDAWLKPIGYSGGLTQALGSEPLNIEITCDLDFSPSALTWLRPQTTAVKTDAVPYQIFTDILHNEGITQDYHTLTLSTSGPSLKVRLVSMTPDLSSESNKVVLHFREYREDSASDETITQRFGFS